MKNFNLLYLIPIFLIFILMTFSVVSYFSLNYPLKYEKEIIYFSNKYNLDENLVKSLINVESSYRENALSTSNAMGLMQIMPTTAIEVAQKLKIEDFNVFKLYNKDINLEIGCYYLSYLILLFNNNTLNALCAYNAGLSNVKRWLANESFSKDGVNLDIIPFFETKNYIDKINKNYKIYKYIR